MSRADVVTRFYEAFARRDVAGMAACYHPEATFTLEDGLIRTHRDRFSFWTWARQAFGIPGLLLGWTPWFHAKEQAEALRALAGYRTKASLR